MRSRAAKKRFLKACWGGLCRHWALFLWTALVTSIPVRQYSLLGYVCRRTQTPLVKAMEVAICLLAPAAIVAISLCLEYLAGRYVRDPAVRDRVTGWGWLVTVAAVLSSVCVSAFVLGRSDL
ncbi:MAG: hypothetical protein AMJ81_11485 [Phycisphaerae bacterium SM23_33]|jgi:hypothetical protein|nr:MAG: hypothetical protein AMJ81_11485 [Phycisphaerae bacterium SM23_33]